MTAIGKNVYYDVLDDVLMNIIVLNIVLLK